MIDIPLDKLSYEELLALGDRSKDHRVVSEILSRKEEGRPKVVSFKSHNKLTGIQDKLVRLLSGALIQEPYPNNTSTVHLGFAKHTTRGGWVMWLTTTSEKDMVKPLQKISRLRSLVEKEKQSGLCRVYIIPVSNKNEGWEGLKVRIDQGTRLVYENL